MKRIGDILIEAGFLDPAELERALQERRLPGERLGALLVRLGIVSEEVLVKALARHFRLPLLDVGAIEIPEKVLGLLPQTLLMDHQILPVALKSLAGQNHLLLALSDPTESDVIAELEKASPYPIRIALASPQQIRMVLVGHFGEEEPTASVARHTPEPPMVLNESTFNDESEVTRLTREPGALDEEDSEILRSLTEPTQSGYRLDKKQINPSPPGPVNQGAAPPAELVAQIKSLNKSVLLEGLVQVLVDRKVITLEELMAAVELRK